MATITVQKLQPASVPPNKLLHHHCPHSLLCLRGMDKRTAETILAVIVCFITFQLSFFPTYDHFIDRYPSPRSNL